MKIGILAVQGAFAEHEQKLTALGADVFEIRQAKDLQNPMDGLILPGGESTVMGKLLHDLDLFDPLHKRIKEGIPVMAQQAVSAQAGVSGMTAPKKKELPEAMPEEIEKLCREWKQIVSGSTGLLRQALLSAYPTVNERNQLMLVYDEPDGAKSINSSILASEDTMADLEAMVEEAIGKHVPIVVEVNKSGATSSQLYTNAVDYFAKVANIEIEEEDF